MFSELNLPFE